MAYLSNFTFRTNTMELPSRNELQQAISFLKNLPSHNENAASETSTVLSQRSKDNREALQSYLSTGLDYAQPIDKNDDSIETTTTDMSWEAVKGDAHKMAAWYQAKYPDVRVEPFFWYWLSRKQIQDPMTDQEIAQMERNSRKAAKLAAKIQTKKLQKRMTNAKKFRSSGNRFQPNTLRGHSGAPALVESEDPVLEELVADESEEESDASSPVDEHAPTPSSSISPEQST